jgi:diaminopimelate epimerase
LVKLYRSHGLGNDYLVLEDESKLDAALVQALCDRHRGVGGDGVLQPIPGVGADYGVRIWNPDGSVAETSGNGLRIYASWLREFRGAPGSFSIWTGSDRVRCVVGDREVEVEMGTASFEPSSIPLLAEKPVIDERWTLGEQSFPVCALSMGNPHCVAFTEESLDELDWRDWGRRLEVDPRFPNRTNVQVARVISRDEVEIRIWERGAGETLASGTSSCAVAVAGVETGRLAAGWIGLQMPGGRLEVYVGGNRKVTLRGPVEGVGRVEVAAGWLRARLAVIGETGTEHA